jgi:dTMP kinase
MGKLIVLEGIDGSGKSTQLRLLTERLAREGLEFQTVRFPRYDNPSSALVRQYLAGDFGTRPDDVNAYAASAFFAVDRFASYKTEPWGAFLDAGGVVLTDRYTTSNAIHQGAKLNKPERQAFFRWLYDFEFGQMGLPRPTAVIYHDINAADAIARIKTRDGAADIHENDADYLAKCADCAGEAACILGWTPVDAFRSEAEIHEEIYALVRGEFQ